MKHAKIKHKRRIDIGFRQIDRLRVSSGSREEFDAVVFTFGEGDEFGEGDLFGGAEIRREGNIPWAVDYDRFGNADGGHERHLSFGVCDGENAVFPCGQRNGFFISDDIVVWLADDSRRNLDGAVFGEADFERLAVQRVFDVQMLQMEHCGITAEHVVGSDDVERTVFGDEFLDVGGDILAGEAVVRGVCRFIDNENALILFCFLRIPCHVGDMVDAAFEAEELLDGGLAEDYEQRTGLRKTDWNADSAVHTFVSRCVNAFSSLSIPQFGHAIVDAEDACEIDRHGLRIADEIPVVAVVILTMEIGDGAFDLSGQEGRLEIRLDGEIVENGFRFDAEIDAAFAEGARRVFFAIEASPQLADQLLCFDVVRRIVCETESVFGGFAKKDDGAIIGEIDELAEDVR